MTKSIPQIAKTSVLTESSSENIHLISQNVCSLNHMFSIVSTTSKYTHIHIGVSFKFEIQILITIILLRSQKNNTKLFLSEFVSFKIICQARIRSNFILQTGFTTHILQIATKMSNLSITSLYQRSYLSASSSCNGISRFFIK